MTNRLFNDAVDKKERKSKLVKDQEQKRLENCTFKPQVSKHAQRMSRVQRHPDINVLAAEELQEQNAILLRKRAKTTVALKRINESTAKSQS